jgi:hypothetical protein
MMQVQSVVPSHGPHKRPKGRPKKFHEWDPVNACYVFNPQLKEQQKMIDDANRYNPQTRTRPKRAVSSFILFMTETRKAMAASSEPDAIAFKQLGFGDSQRKLAEMWKNADPAVKQTYKARAEVERQRYMTATAQLKPAKKPRKSHGDPNRLKRPPSSFLLFCQTRRDQVQAENPGQSMREITKIMGHEWKVLPKSHKAQFGHQAHLLLEEYRKVLTMQQAEQEAQMQQAQPPMAMAPAPPAAGMPPAPQ